IVGTLQYMSPEQLEGRDADIRSDLWAFGCITYELITGKKAFTGTSSIDVIAAILRDEPPAIMKMQPLTPVTLERVVKRCLAKDADDRWQSAGDLKYELTWIGEELPGTGLPTRNAILGQWRTRWVLVAAFLLGSLATAGVLHFRSQSPDAPVIKFSLPPPQ